MAARFNRSPAEFGAGRVAPLLTARNIHRCAPVPSPVERNQFITSGHTGTTSDNTLATPPFPVPPFLSSSRGGGSGGCGGGGDDDDDSGGQGRPEARDTRWRRGAPSLEIASRQKAPDQVKRINETCIEIFLLKPFLNFDETKFYSDVRCPNVAIFLEFLRASRKTIFLLIYAFLEHRAFSR